MTGSAAAHVNGKRRSVVHVLPFDQARGAQRYARALVDQLDSESQRNLILTLFAAEPVALRADIQLAVPKGRLRRLGFDPRGVWRLRRKLIRSQPDVVVAHGGESAKYAALAMPRDLPLVYVNIGTVHPRMRRPMSSALHPLYLRRADMVVAVSTEVAEEARNLYGVADERIVVIPNGRDASLYVPSPDRRTARRPRLISIGQIDSGKRPEWFVEVVSALRERGHDIEAVMVGEGPRKEEIEALAGPAGVTMLGRRADVPQLLANSDLLVFTSRPPEGMPGVLIEAGLCGIASVSTRVAGAGDVVEDGMTGVLVGIDDQPALIEAVQRLLSDPEARASMGRRARQRCLELFTLEATAAKWREVLERLMGPAERSTR